MNEKIINERWKYSRGELKKFLAWYKKQNDKRYSTKNDFNFWYIRGFTNKWIRNLLFNIYK